MLGDKLEYLPELRVKRPVPELLHIGPLYLVDSKQTLVVGLMLLEEAGLADQTCGQFALGLYANVHDLLALVAGYQAFRGYRPAHFMDFIVYSCQGVGYEGGVFYFGQGACFAMGFLLGLWQLAHVLL